MLLIGHMDTVFEPASPFQPFEQNGNIARGTGAGDMKGGLVLLLSALKALHKTGALKDTTITKCFSPVTRSPPGEPLSLSRGSLIAARKSKRREDVLRSGGAEGRQRPQHDFAPR